MFTLFFTGEAAGQLRTLKSDLSLAKRYKAVKKYIEYLASSSRHPGLRSHQFTSLSGPVGEEVFEAYAEQSTPAAYRVFWHYGPEEPASRSCQ